MAVRDAMAALIARTRGMVGDPAGATAVLTDQAVQDALDRYMQDIRLLALTPRPQIDGGGLVSYLEYFAPWGDWEAGAALRTLNFVLLTEDVDYTADALAGKWTLAVSHYPPVYLSGQTYDLNLAASELLQARAAGTAGAYDYSQNGQSFHRSQQFAAWMELSRYYRSRGRVTTGTVGRGDLAPPGRSPHGR